MIKPNHFKTENVKIGIDLHNLSLKTDSNVRTGIQQVVFNLLEAQYLMRNKTKNIPIELIPIPMLPKPPESWSRFTNLMDTNVNNSSFVLKSVSEELGVPLQELWNDKTMEDSQNWTEEKFYKIVSTLDWLVFIPLGEFRHVAEEAKRLNPSLRIAVLVYDIVALIRTELVADGMPHWFFCTHILGIRHFADVLFTISRHTAFDCMNELGTILGAHVSIIATPLPSEIPLIVEEKPSFLKSFDIAKNFYFICLGTIEPRKNLSLAINGFLRFKQIFPKLAENFKMILIGASGWSNEDKILSKKIQDKQEYFILPGYLPRAEIEQLIRHANALIMPSRYEGFGMPLSLARELGTKVITCHNSSLPEAAGFDATYVPVDSPDTLALALAQHAYNQDSFKGKPISLYARNKEIRQEWQNILERWVETFTSFKKNLNHESSNLQRTPNRLKICIDVHNLSIDPKKLVKTGIQEVNFQLLKSLALLRSELADIVEIIAIPILPNSTKYFSFFKPTFNCSPKLLQQVELEISKETGISGNDLWGFDLESMKYNITPMDFCKLVSDTDWFFVTSQYDIRRCYKKLKESSPKVKISYLIYDLIPALFPELVVRGLDTWFTYEYLRSIRNFSSLALTISRASALDLLNHTEGEELPFPVYSRLLPLKQNNSSSETKFSANRLNFKLPTKNELTPRKYFLLLGSTDPRKNTAKTIKGFTRFHHIYKAKVSDYKLAIVGPKHWRSNVIGNALEQASKECDIVEISYVPDDVMHSLVKNSSGVLMPSLYEGFGIPLALARSYGIPTLTASNSSLVEVTEANTIFVDPGSKDSLALGMYELLQQPFQNISMKDDWLSYTRDLIQLHLQESTNIKLDNTSNSRVA